MWGGAELQQVFELIQRVLQVWVGVGVGVGGGAELQQVFKLIQRVLQVCGGGGGGGLFWPAFPPPCVLHDSITYTLTCPPLPPYPPCAPERHWLPP